MDNFLSNQGIRNLLEELLVIEENGKDLSIEFLMKFCEQKRYTELVELLIAKNFDIDMQDKKGRNILMHLLIITYYVMKESNLETDEWTYDIYLEVERVGLLYEIKEAIELLIKNGTKIDVMDKRGLTSLDYAFKAGNVGIIKLFLEKGVRISCEAKKYINARFLIDNISDRQFIKLLLQQEIDLNKQDDMGITILMIASDKGDKELVKDLIKNGANVNIQNSYGDTALIIASSSGHVDVVDILLKENALINCKDINGITALMCACVKGHIGVIKLLLEKNANLDVQDTKGFTALMMAACEEDEEAIRLLIEKGAGVNITNYGGFTFLNPLCRKKNINILKLVIKHTDIDNDVNWVARLAVGYINYEAVKNIDILKKIVSNIPSGRKFHIYKQFFKEMEGRFESIFNTKTSRYKIMMKADPLFFNILNTVNQILNRQNNIGNSIEKLYLVMTGFCGMIRKYYDSKDVFATKFIESTKNSAENMMRSEKEEDFILNIEKTLNKIRREELSFLLVKTKAGNIHNIPEIVFKIRSGPLKGKYAFLLVNFGYGYDLNNLGASQVTMYIFSMDLQNEVKEVARAIFEISNDFGNNKSDASKITDFYKNIHKLFFRKSKRIVKLVYGINEAIVSKTHTDKHEKEAFVSAETNKNLGIVLRFGNNMPKNICNCYIKQQQKALELIFSILKTCHDKRYDNNFDIISFMRSNSLDEKKTLKYTHLNGLLIQETKEKKSKGINTKKFKKEFVEEILKVAVKGYVGEKKDIRRITKKEAISIKKELFPKNGVDYGFAR